MQVWDAFQVFCLIQDTDQLLDVVLLCQRATLITLTSPMICSTALSRPAEDFACILNHISCSLASVEASGPRTSGWLVKVVASVLVVPVPEVVPILSTQVMRRPEMMKTPWASLGRHLWSAPVPPLPTQLIPQMSLDLHDELPDVLTP